MLSVVALQIYIHINSIWGFLFSTSLPILFKNYYSYSNRYKVIPHCGLICISLVISGIKYFSCICWPICISSFKKFLFRSAHLSHIIFCSQVVWVVFNTWMLILLSDIWLKNILTKFHRFLFILLLGSFCCAVLSWFILLPLVNLWICWCQSKKLVPRLDDKAYHLCFSSRSLAVSGLTVKSLIHFELVLYMV